MYKNQIFLPKKEHIKSVLNVTDADMQNADQKKLKHGHKVIVTEITVHPMEL